MGFTARQRCCSAFALAVTLVSITATSHAETTWSSFRNGGSSQSKATNVPLQWSTDAGISWQRELPGYGQSAPVLYDGIVYLTAVKGPMKEESLVLAFDTKSGELVWEQAVKTSMPANSYYAKSRAAPTPVVDDNGVYAFFEGGDVVGLSHQGEIKWQRSLAKEYGEFENGHGLGSSLAQTEDAVIVLIDHSGPSYLLAIHKSDGKNLWKTERESRSSWTSPTVAELSGTRQVVVSSNGSVDGYDAKTGSALWSFDDIGGNTIASAAVVGNRVYAGASFAQFRNGDGEQSSCCLEINGSNSKVLWRAKKAHCHYASPLPYKDCVYHINKVGVLYCLDADTGETHYAERTADLCWSTPVAVGDHIYLFAKNGTTTVIKAGPKFEKVAVNSFWDSENPPLPETYTQNPPERSSRGRGSFADRLKESDKDKDGKITEAEVPESMKRFFGRLDANGDGAIDADELKQMSERSRRRSSDSEASESYGDPIVYGVAVGDNAFFVRTGTRLFCIRND